MTNRRRIEIVIDAWCVFSIFATIFVLWLVTP